MLSKEMVDAFGTILSKENVVSLRETIVVSGQNTEKEILENPQIFRVLLDSIATPNHKEICKIMCDNNSLAELVFELTANQILTSIMNIAQKEEMN